MRRVMGQFLKYLGLFSLAVVVLGGVAVAGRAFLPASVVPFATATPTATPTSAAALVSATPTPTPDYGRLIGEQRTKVYEVQAAIYAAMASDAAQTAYLAPEKFVATGRLLSEAREGIRSLPQTGTIGAARTKYLSSLELMETARRLSPRFYMQRVLDLITQADAAWRAGDDAR